jgi:hypothetical protein
MLLPLKLLIAMRVRSAPGRGQHIDPMTRIAITPAAFEAIAAFSGTPSWRGSLQENLLPAALVKGHEIMISFEQFLNDHPDMADKPYGDAMASTLSRAFPCQAH